MSLMTDCKSAGCKESRQAGSQLFLKYLRTDLDSRHSNISGPSSRVVINFFYSDRGGTVQRGYERML